MVIDKSEVFLSKIAKAYVLRSREARADMLAAFPEQVQEVIKRTAQLLLGTTKTKA